MSVLITGGAGYIGSHLVWRLVEAGETVVVIDDLSSGRRDAIHPHAVFHQGNAGDDILVRDLIATHRVDSVIHLAASISVSESVDNPLKYYRNNSGVSRRLIECCTQIGMQNFIFASSASVYGEPRSGDVNESASLNPVNPYGRSKHITEWMLADAYRAHGMRYASLRYFNVAGTARAGAGGWSVPSTAHLIGYANKVALGRERVLNIFGTDYPTQDGTCVRDYIHIEDLGEIHLRMLAFLREGGMPGPLNCGYGRGFSVRDVISAVERVSGNPLPTKAALRRKGDTARVVADSTRLRFLLDWSPQHEDIDVIIRSDYEREKARSAAS
jgi:UDP-glucose 4-epimerase